MSTSSLNLDSYEGFDRQFKLDVAETAKPYLIIDRHGTHIRLTPSAYTLLWAAKSGISFERLAKMLNANRAMAQRATAAQLRAAYQEIAQKLVRVDREHKKRTLPWGFWLLTTIIPQKYVLRIVSRFVALYKPWVASFVLLIIVWAVADCWIGGGMKLPTGSNSLLWGYLIFCCSLFPHEFGHAAACARYGASPSDIGFTMYLIYPALYSDVTSTWQLNRWQRVVVDLGGCYFQLFLGCCFWQAFRASGWVPFRIAFVMIIYATVFSLNPIFRFDGYWVMTDLLGVTNLSRQPSRLRNHLWSLIVRRRTAQLPWRRTTIVVLVAYSLASMVIWLLFIRNLFPIVSDGFARLVAAVSVIQSTVILGHAPKWVDIKVALMSLYLLAMIGAMIWQLAKGAVKYLRNRFGTRISQGVPGPEYNVVGSSQGQQGLSYHLKSIGLLPRLNDGD